MFQHFSIYMNGSIKSLLFVQRQNLKPKSYHNTNKFSLYLMVVTYNILLLK